MFLYWTFKQEATEISTLFGNWDLCSQRLVATALGNFSRGGGGIVPVAPLFTSIHLVFLASLGIAKIFRTFILLVVYSIIRPSWYHVMLAGGLEPYETQSMLLGSPERNGCSTPVMATFNGFTVNYYYYYYQTYCYYKNNNLKKTKTRSSVADPYLPSE